MTILRSLLAFTPRIVCSPRNNVSLEGILNKDEFYGIRRGLPCIKWFYLPDEMACAFRQYTTGSSPGCWHIRITVAFIIVASTRENSTDYSFLSIIHMHCDVW
jgi:hypothetical protein